MPTGPKFDGLNLRRGYVESQIRVSQDHTLRDQRPCTKERTDTVFKIMTLVRWVLGSSLNLGRRCGASKTDLSIFIKA